MKRKKPMAIKVELVSSTGVKPLELASHAAMTCYQAESPQWGKTLDVRGRLFDVGHHTTLQHFFFTFSIEGIAVGDITFGMHLVSPFYNSDQRSGRFCAKMFLEPNYVAIENYIKTFWPKVEREALGELMDYIIFGVNVFHQNIDRATQVAKGLIQEERPFANKEYVEQNGPKIAQEQLRAFIPVIFPTGFDFTVNETVLAAMYRTAWTPAMKYVVGEMVKAVLAKFPELDFMFAKEEVSKGEWAMLIPDLRLVKITEKPCLKLLEVLGEKGFVSPKKKDMHPVDLLHFSPEYMDNSTGEVITKAWMSVATMGQDQRHRTIRRSQPSFTGGFYLPPIVKEMGLEKEGLELMKKWARVSKKIPNTLAMIIAPYGAVVTYEKTGSFNAVLHEQAKRLCWCAQEEIYNLGRLLREQLLKNGHKKLAQMLEPQCYQNGQCAEGVRYCGRDINLRKKKGGNYFPKREI